MAAERYFRFAQLDVPGRLGIEDGRYLLRSEDESAEAVVVVQTLGAPAAVRRSARRRRPRPAAPEAGPAEVPLTRLTVIPADETDRGAAERELERLGRDGEAAEAALGDGLRAVNEVLRVHQVATGDPYGHEISRDAALTTRVGYGTGAGLAEGRWEEALELQPSERRRRRAEALRPQERLAAVLAGREPIDICETLLLRARADLDQGRRREASLQLKAGLEALLAELPQSAGPDQEEDLAALDAARADVARGAREALDGDLPPGSAERLADTLAICERVLRRRQILR